MTRRVLTAIIYLIPTLLYAQDQKKLTGAQIVDASIAFCGGEARLSKINSVEINYLVIEPNYSTEIVNVKLKTGEKYSQCMLSKTASPQTTFFNGEKISKVDGSSVTHLTNIQLKEEVKLKTYSQIQYGYKKLNYKLSRLPDKKFENADCFVVIAKARNGYATMNFFDKKDHRLIMVVYPNGNKSVITDHIFKDGVLFNSRIINTFANSKDLQNLQTWELQTVDLNKNISDVWFSCPYSDKVLVPEYIKIGKFASTNGEPTTFIRNKISMDYTDKDGKVDLRRFLAWILPDTFALMDEEAFKNDDRSSTSQILVRVISWDEHGYVCQWITDKYTNTQDYKLIK